MQGETTEERSGEDHPKECGGTCGVSQDREHPRAPPRLLQERQCSSNAKAPPWGSEALGRGSPLEGRGKAFRVRRLHPRALPSAREEGAGDG